LQWTHKLKFQKYAKVIAVIKNVSVWGYNSKDYLQSLNDYIRQNFVSVEGNIFISPSLARDCKITP